MRKRVLFIAFLVFVVIAIFWRWALPNRDPLHKGKPIGYWIDQPRQYGEIKQIGQAAVPYLVARLRTRDTWWRTGWNKFHRLLPTQLRHKLPSYKPASEIQSRAIQYLEAFGPDAKLAAPELAKLATDRSSPPGGVVIASLNALRAIGPEAAAALPLLEADLQSRDPWTQVETARALWSIGRETNLALQIFTNSVLSGKFGAVSGANGLGEMGSAAGPAVSIIVSFLHDETRDATLRGNLGAALGNIGIVNDEIMLALLIGTRDPNHHVSGNSAVALWRLKSPDLEIAVPIAVRFAVIDLRWASLVKFAQRNQLDLESAIPTLRKMVEDESPQVRKAVVEALAEPGAEATKQSKDK